MRPFSSIFAVASIACVFFAGYGFLIGDIMFASTQWLLMSAVLGIWAVLMKLK